MYRTSNRTMRPPSAGFAGRAWTGPGDSTPGALQPSSSRRRIFPLTVNDSGSTIPVVDVKENGYGDIPPPRRPAARHHAGPVGPRRGDGVGRARDARGGARARPHHTHHRPDKEGEEGRGRPPRRSPPVHLPSAGERGTGPPLDGVGPHVAAL